jgi:signal transduction histidine kinase
MTFSALEKLRWPLLCGLAIVLGLLAWLQYRAIKKVRDATTAQMQTSLQGALMDVRQGLHRELTPLCRELEAETSASEQNALQEYLVRFERWRRATAHPTLVADVFIWQGTDSVHGKLLKLNASQSAFEPAIWPENLTSLRDKLWEMQPGPGGQDGGDHFGPPPDWHDGPRGDGPAPNFHSFPGHDGPPPDFRGDFSSHRPPGSHDEYPPPAPWMIDQNFPALIRRISDDRTPFPGQPPTTTWIAIVLNREVLEHHIFPELVTRYFGKNDRSAYTVAIVDQNKSGGVLYSSDSGFGTQKDTAADATLNLFGSPSPTVKSQSTFTSFFIRRGPTSKSRPATQEGPSASTSNLHEENLVTIDPIRDSPDDHGWEIIARHREGSVEAAVTALFHRNLLTNFGVLLLLAATMLLIIVTSQRARTLAQLQMDFTASVSHELRTPLTGIVAAAQNIADGVVDDKQTLVRYGSAIVNQAQQLTELVEQILLFSATQKGRHRYHLQPVEVPEAIAVSMKTLSTQIRAGGFSVEQEIQSDLPPVLADFKALTQCLQNLIANSIKYSGDSRWIGIRASLAQAAKEKEVLISIADKGIGIHAEDLVHIFEPFYRSSKVTEAQIHGTGLGLPLAKSMVQAMGGKLTVESVPQKGSTFTIHLPIP